MKIAIAGAAGRMGQMLIAEIARTEGCTLAAALEGPGSNKLGSDAGGGVKIVSDAAAAIGAADTIIDFTVPAATVAHARIAADKGVAMVIGTTGLNPEQTAAVHECAKKTPILWAANMSIGVNVLLSLVEKTASMLDPAKSCRQLRCELTPEMQTVQDSKVPICRVDCRVPRREI